jgi:type I restriction enzyme S subunit
MTADGNLPSEWALSRLGDITLESAFGPRFPATNYDPLGNFGTLRTTDISKDGRINYQTIPRAKLDEQFRGHVLRDGDVVVTRSGTCGIVSVFRAQSFDVIPAAFLIRFRLHERAFPQFVQLAMMGPKAQSKIQSMAAGGVQKNLSGTNLAGLELLLPPLGEQRKIAAILTSVDDAMEATQAVIEQLQVVKKAMMAELLTRGIPGRHTRFKITEIGEIPEEWEVVKLGDVLSGIDSGWSPQCESRPADAGAWGVLKVSAVTSGVYKEAEQKALPQHLQPRPQAEVKAGDVLLARANGVLELVGKTVFVRATRSRLMLSDKLLRLTPMPSVLNGAFLTLAMATEAVRARLLNTTGGSHMRNVSQSNLRDLRLPLPTVTEQGAIADMFDALDERSSVERLHWLCLAALKTALMSVLLTGEVRVTPDEPR